MIHPLGYCVHSSHMIAIVTCYIIVAKSHVLFNQIFYIQWLWLRPLLFYVYLIFITIEVTVNRRQYDFEVKSISNRRQVNELSPWCGNPIQTWPSCCCFTFSEAVLGKRKKATRGSDLNQIMDVGGLVILWTLYYYGFRWSDRDINLFSSIQCITVASYSVIGNYTRLVWICVRALS